MPIKGSLLDKVEKWLKNMDLKDIKRDEANSMLFVAFGISGNSFLVQTRVSEDWINIKALVALLKDIPKEERENLFYSCLVANFTHHEVTFSADANGIWVEADMPKDTTESNFKVEFGSVVYGVTHFIEQIAPKIKFNVRSTIFT
nr:hypothetical protein [Candidatus Freyarchaeota archaeon]